MLRDERFKEEYIGNRLKVLSKEGKVEMWGFDEPLLDHLVIEYICTSL